jgi:glutamate racemase
VFDSGVGGITILRAVRDALPHDDLIYVADSAHLPYWQKQAQLVRKRAIAITGFRAELGVKAVVAHATPQPPSHPAHCARALRCPSSA